MRVASCGRHPRGEKAHAGNRGSRARENPQAVRNGCRLCARRGCAASQREIVAGFDSVAVTRGHIATGFFEGKAATVCRKHIKDFVERIGLVTQSARTGVKVRRHDLQRYSRIVSSFLARLPFGAILRLLQAGQRSGA